MQQQLPIAILRKASVPTALSMLSPLTNTDKERLDKVIATFKEKNLCIIIGTRNKQKDNFCMCLFESLISTSPLGGAFIFTSDIKKYSESRPCNVYLLYRAELVSDIKDTLDFINKKILSGYKVILEFETTNFNDFYDNKLKPLVEGYGFILPLNYSNDKVIVL